MAQKNTVAIIGASGSLGAYIAKGLCSGPYRLLLMDAHLQSLDDLKTEINLLCKYAEVDVLQCCRDASWEADIILLAVGKPMDIALEIEEVATRKIVINIISAGGAGEDLQQMLPFSKVVNVVLSSAFEEPAPEIESPVAFVEGYEEDAIKTSVDMMTLIGFNTVVSVLKAEDNSGNFPH